MAEIIPTVLAQSTQEFNSISGALSFAPALHLDVMDGTFAKPASINVVQLYWQPDIHAHMHMMVDDPMEHVETLIAKQPEVIILHAESASFSEAFTELQAMNMTVHVALLSETLPEDVPELALADGCLIFGGKLGSYGGQADLKQLTKVERIKTMNPEAVIGWDGGANEDTIPQIKAAGVELINVGSALQKAKNPQEAYATLKALVPKSQSAESGVVKDESTSAGR